MLSKMKDIIGLPFTKSLHTSLQNDHSLIQIIIGPRQVGKTTTILKYLNENHLNKFSFYSADQVFNANPSWLLEIWSLPALKIKYSSLMRFKNAKTGQKLLKILG
jgi:predicted AAA+ superfamily ATPase